MPIPLFKRYQSALDKSASVVLTALGLALTASVLFVGS
jgi:hypothetical protein